LRRKRIEEKNIKKKRNKLRIKMRRNLLKIIIKGLTIRKIKN